MKKDKLIYLGIFLIISLVLLTSSMMLLYQSNKNSELIPKPIEYPLHKNITVTFFWVGEESGPENHFIPNDVSAWDGKWQEHFGGVDNPEKRNGYYPLEFIPKENPFYFALPYNDFTESGKRKENSKLIYWYDETVSQKESLLKNRWIKITKDNRTVYAQWEDSGPFQYDDINYVFGNNKPKNNLNQNAGIDVSPAVRDYLTLEDIDKVDWKFVDFSDVPEGPWRSIVTTSQVDWN
jgi:hypothetical protein